MILERSFLIDDVTIAREAAGDGRTMTLRAVPYGVVTVVRDKTATGDLTPPYRESWEEGAFRHVLRAAHRVPLIVGDHGQRRTNPFADVGKGIEFLERSDGLIGVFRVDMSPFGDATIAKVESGQWRHASVGAAPRKHRDDGDPFNGGVRVRTLAHLDHVLLTDTPAYTDAEVLAVRSDTPELDRWLAKYPLTR